MSRPLHPPSPALLAAQERLLALREAHRAQHVEKKPPFATDQAVLADHGRIPAANPSPLPTHLGWHSAAVTAHLHQRLPIIEEVVEENDPLPPPAPPTAPAKPPRQTAVSLRVYPDMALAILREEAAAPARVWYLLRHLDEAGSGWIEETAVRTQLTGKESPLRLCGPRQLRNLLAQGDGLFWERQNGRVWLRSLSKVAAGLGVMRLQGRPVAVPLAHFKGGIGTFRAHLYATFHSGRGKADKTAAPIARETITRLSSVPARTQRLYEKQAGVKKKRNFALGPRLTPTAVQEQGWQRGNALFKLTDHQGQHGPAGATYLAWQLPNSYTGPHPQQSNGRQKRLNQTIADLLPIGMTGNDNQQVEARRHRRYCPHGKMAARLFNRSPRDFYWPAPASSKVWYAIT